MICKNEKCRKEFLSEIYNRIYCSIKCRNFYNQKKWVREHRNKCECGASILQKSKKCLKCIKNNLDNIKNMTIQEYQDLPSVQNKHPSWKNSHIRQFARSWNKPFTKNGCQRKGCTYSLHVEICHIKPICEFPLTTKLGEVNHISNILALCRNCHWEFDHKKLILDQINTKCPR